VLDLTERKRAEEALREAQTQLAHVNRVTTMGQLTASIAHEVKTADRGGSCQCDRGFTLAGPWPPDLEEVRQSLDSIIKDSNRSRRRHRSHTRLVKKAPHDRISWT